MATLRNELMIESASLISITRHVKDFLLERLSERTYLIEAEVFFDYIKDSLVKIESTVRDTVKDLDNLTNTSILATLKDYDALQKVIWNIYRFVRQVCDADTLNIPFPIIAYINKIVDRFPSTSPIYKTKIILLATDELNFFHRRLDILREVSEKCIYVSDFPQDIGIIAFPYTERNNICLNTALFHEFGHYVFKKTQVQQRLSLNLAELQSKVGALPTQGLFDSEIMKKLAIQRTFSWCEELFADLLATGLVGPSYAVSFDRLVRFKGTDKKESMKFSDKHPADGYRKYNIANMLNEKGWIQAIEDVDENKANEHFISSLKDDLNTSQSFNYPIDNIQLSEIMINNFIDLTPQIRQYVQENLSHFTPPIEDFLRNYKTVTDSLTRLVVPSVSYDCQTKSLNVAHETILICGSLILRQELEDVFTLCNRDRKNISDRFWIEEKINRLALKALEDCLIVERWNAL